MTLALLFILSMAACGASTGTTPSEAPANDTASSATEAPAVSTPAESMEQPAQATAQAPESPAEAVPVVYDMPLTDTPVTFTFWIEGAPPFVTPTLGSEQSYNTSEASLYLANRSNVNIEFIEVDMFSRTEKFNILMASGDYPDMISGFKNLYTGSLDQAQEEGIIINVTDMVENDMPAYKQILDADPIYMKELLNDSGEILFISGFNDEIYASSGPAIRKDWLDALSLDIPQTYDELHDVAKAFLAEYGCTTPIYFTDTINPDVTFSGGFDLPSFDITDSGSHFFQKDGKVTSAYIEDDLKDMLKMLNGWYSEGLLNPDFYTMQSGQYAESTIFSDNSGVFWGPANFISQYNETPDLKDKGFYAVGMPIMRKTEGQTIHFTTALSNSYSINDLCISTKCGNLDVLAKWLDFMFTEDGQLLNNYGLEGKSYEFDSQGNAQYFPELYSTPGTNFMQNSANYLYNSAPSLFIADRVDRVSFDDVAKEAVERYNEGYDSAYDLPSNLYMTLAESEAYANKIGDIETYVSSEIIKFITGSSDIDSEWDTYIAMVKQLGIQDCIDAKQAAYDRYLER